MHSVGMMRVMALHDLGCTASCGWHVRCVGVRGDAWSVLLSPCNTT